MYWKKNQYNVLFKNQFIHYLKLLGCVIRKCFSKTHIQNDPAQITSVVNK